MAGTQSRTLVLLALIDRIEERVREALPASTQIYVELQSPV